MADIRKPPLPNGGSATLTPRAQKGLSERECVDPVVGGDIKPVFGGDERLKMVQTAHCLRRSCERLAAIGPERVQPVVALGAHDQYDRIRAAVGCCYDRRAGVGDGTTPGGLDRRRGIDANFQRIRPSAGSPRGQCAPSPCRTTSTPSAALQTAGDVMAIFVVTRAFASAPPTPPRLSRSRR
jgi:hypothetical protein